MPETWDINHEEGTAVGPSVMFEGTLGVTITATALWSDEDGIGIALEVFGDGLVTSDNLEQFRASAGQVMSAVDSLLDLTPPSLTSSRRG